MNENNPPMVLPNGYVYGDNVSLCTNPLVFNLRIGKRIACHQNEKNAIGAIQSQLKFKVVLSLGSDRFCF